MSQSRVKEIPQHFLPIKKEFQRLENTYWYNKQTEDQKRNESPYNIGLLYVLLNDFASFAENKQYNIGSKLMEIMGTEDWEILFGEFGKKVCYSKEANWIDVLDMNKEDFVKYDTECNKSYIEGKK